MDQKAFSILFVVVLVIGIATLAVSQAGGLGGASPSPSPTASADLFGAKSSAPPATPVPDVKAAAIQAAQLQQQVQNQSNQQPMAQQQQQKQIKQYKAFPGVLPAEQLKNRVGVIETNKGEIVFEINPNAPKAASNFIALAGDHFYDGLTFHRVVPGFVIQGGDPFGNGTGGPGYKFEDEPVTEKYTKGTVAMANSGPNTNGSQFFIMLEDNPTLPPNYTIFGHVVKGQEVVDQIAVGDIMQKVHIEGLQ